MFKGIFWFVPQSDVLIVKKVACTSNGEALETTNYSSKSGDNFNHRLEWSNFSRKVTNGLPYNYYPRGRVEVKNGSVNVYMNPTLKTPMLEERIKAEFMLVDESVSVRFIADGSMHYQYLVVF